MWWLVAGCLLMCGGGHKPPKEHPLYPFKYFEGQAMECFTTDPWFVFGPVKGKRTSRERRVTSGVWDVCE